MYVLIHERHFACNVNEVNLFISTESTAININPKAKERCPALPLYKISFSVAKQPKSGLGHLIIEVHRLNRHKHTETW
jgi:hypothetical protein